MLLRGVEPRHVAALSSRLWKGGSEMHSRSFAGCVVVTSQVGGEMLAGSTAVPCPLVRCRNVGCQTTLLPSGLSPTMLLLLVVTDKLLLAVLELAVHS